MEYMMPRVTSNVGVCSQRYHWIEKQVHGISELHQVAKKKTNKANNNAPPSKSKSYQTPGH